MRENKLHLRQLAAVVLFAAVTICGALPGSSSPRTETCLLQPFSDSVWFDSVSGPADTITTDTVLTLSGTAMLRASQDAPGTDLLVILYAPGETKVHLYSFDLSANESVAVDWQYDFDPETAFYVVRESLIDGLPAARTDSSFVTWQFWVFRRPHGGVDDGGGQPTTEGIPAPSVLRRVPAGTVAYDVMGKIVPNPRRGIYFLVSDWAVAPRKVILVE